VCVCPVACKVHATLHQPSAGDVESVESIITYESRGTLGETDEVNRLASKLEGIAINPEKLNKLKSLLRKSGFKMTFKKSNSILCYFICSSEEQIWQLRRWFKSGRLQTFLDNVFTLLVGSSEKISIDQLTWNLDDYNESLVRLSQLKALGMCFFLERVNLFSLSCLCKCIT
jgi:hypothetical protein